MVLTVDDDDQLVGIRADREDGQTLGFACFKGLQAPAMHYAPSRLLQSLKRGPDGAFHAIPVEQAFDEIAARLIAIRDRSGVDAIGLFRGTAGFHNSTAFGIHGSFLRGAITTRMVQFTRLSPKFRDVMQDLFAGTQPYIGLKRRLMKNLSGSLLAAAATAFLLLNRDGDLSTAHSLLAGAIKGEPHSPIPAPTPKP